MRKGRYSNIAPYPTLTVSHSPSGSRDRIHDPSPGPPDNHEPPKSASRRAPRHSLRENVFRLMYLMYLMNASVLVRCQTQLLALRMVERCTIQHNSWQRPPR